MSQFQDLYIKVLCNSDFRSQLVSDPSDALESVGIAPTPEVLAAIQNVVTAVNKVGDDLDRDGLGGVRDPVCVS
jgi:hypothetical protein